MKHLGWTKERPKEECVFAVCCIRENCEGKIVRDYDIWRIENYESDDGTGLALAWCDREGEFMGNVYELPDNHWYMVLPFPEEDAK